MDFNEYQYLATLTWNKEPNDEMRLANAALGLAGESGEVLEPIKKHLFHNKPLDNANLSKELGDVLYYVAILAAERGLDLNTVARNNYLKLKARYPNGFGERHDTGQTNNDNT
jgi:NTP pyrophosphatase (non-canonical NTP hydrolase)